MGKKKLRGVATPVLTKIQRELKYRGISQQEIADKVLMTGVQHQVSDRLTGKVGLSLDEYMALCDYIHVPYDYFMKGE